MSRVLVLGLLLTTSTGCAAVFKGSKQEVRFVADPERSDVRVDGRYLGPTPAVGRVDRDRPQNVSVSKAGFKPQQVQLRKQADVPWFLWDIATCVVPVTLCIPVLVDAISGAWFSFDDEYAVKLDPEPPPAPRPPPAAVTAPTAIVPESAPTPTAVGF
jgi:hypothetical protein